LLVGIAAAEAKWIDKSNRIVVCGGQISMAEQRLDVAQVGAAAEQMRCMASIFALVLGT